jgi:hypothetical protein
VVTKLVQDQFDKGVDPYGRPWAPLAASTLAKGRRPPPLTETRRLREGTRAYVMRAHYAGLRVVVGAPYGYFHQVGFRVGRTKVKPRRILPQFGLPRAWSDALRAASRQAASEAVRGL